jgi:HAD superfamily hydrolase (TIGR01549 family)
MKVQVVFFDIGNTLALTAEQSARQMFAARLRLTDKETKTLGRLIMTHPAESPDELLEALVPALPRHGREPIHAALSTIWKQQGSYPREIPGAHNLLLGLKRLGLKVGVISNTWHPAYQGFRLHCGRLTDLLDFVFLSYQQRCKKPSPDIFQRAIGAVGYPSEACWMIGDSYELDLEPARNLGMQTLWVLRRPERERSLLASILRRVRPGPDWAVSELDEVLPLFQSSS